MEIGKTIGAVVMGTVFAASLAAAQSTASQEPRGETQGVKETEKFIKEGGGVASAVGVAKAQVQSTLTAYNALVSNPSDNMKKDYSKLLKEMKNMDEKAADARTQIGQMQAAAKTYFAGREATIAGIQDAALKKQAQQRLADSQKKHEEVLAALRSAGESLEPIRKDLDDQIKYLGSDLNPSAAGSLAPKAQKLNESGKETFAKADQAITMANDFFNSMKPAK